MASKWAHIRSQRQSAREFARSVLEERVESVVKYLPKAAHEAVDNVENVHQLRVSCRRATAALHTLEPLASGRITNLNKWLKRIRRAAGPARDTDVLLERYSRERLQPTVRNFILSRLELQRAAAQGPLVKIAAKATGKKLSHGVVKACQAFSNKSGGKDATSVLDFARQSLVVASRNFLQQTEVIQPSLTELHQLRIAGKRLRYSIEIFHSAFSEDLRDKFYPMITHLQDRLGRINDHVTAQNLFQEWLALMPPDELAAQLALRVADEHDEACYFRAEFLRDWNRKRLRRIRLSLQTLIPEIGPA